MHSYVEPAASERLTPRSLNTALAEERLRLDRRMDELRNEMAAVGHELAGADRRRSTVDALLADDAGADFALSA
jgi:hypothetical protein